VNLPPSPEAELGTDTRRHPRTLSISSRLRRRSADGDPDDLYLNVRLVHSVPGLSQQFQRRTSCARVLLRRHQHHRLAQREHYPRRRKLQIRRRVVVADHSAVSLRFGICGHQNMTRARLPRALSEPVSVHGSMNRNQPSSSPMSNSVWARPYGVRIVVDSLPAHNAPGKRPSI
jgi:hypothetical protein